jgi:KDO2-lipid IV(A) lauroyltransferase
MSRAADALGLAAYKTVSAAFAVLPRRACRAAGGGLGRLAYRLDRKHRGIALANLATAFGRERTPEELAAVARESFVRFGRVLADILKMARYSRARVLSLIATEGRENLEAALAKGKGALIFTAHFGNWEVLSAAVSEIGPFRAIARALDNPYLEKDLSRFRTRLGSEVINKFGASRPILRALARNEIVAILIDQNVLRSQAVFVDFFGKSAATTPGLAAFHLASGAPLVPLFVDAAAGGRYRLRILPPLEFPSPGRRDEDVLKITQICTKMIEHEIRRTPEQWLWVHKRWNTRPAEEEPS